LFLDASFVVALSVPADQWHAAAQAYWSQVLSQRIALVTTTFVLDEIVTLLSRRGRHGVAVSTGQHLLHSPAVTMVHVDAALLDTGWRYFVRHDDKRYSLTDCISFVVMEKHGLRQALTFDHHFAQAGFDRLPA
jgi:uncharacterized protein